MLKAVFIKLQEYFENKLLKKSLLYLLAEG